MSHATTVRIIPVIDVLQGVVVRGVGGRRHEYRSIVSTLTSSTDPVDVARALIDVARPREMYLADLDAIQDASLAFDVYRSILALGVRLWVDAGVREVGLATQLAETGCDVVAGLETVPSREALQQIVSAIGTERTIFSFDLRDGVPLRAWAGTCAENALTVGPSRAIVLDLASVGTGRGTGTESLCREIASFHPNIEVIAGGGVSSVDDLRRLEACGVKGVLVASALHDGRLGAQY